MSEVIDYKKINKELYRPKTVPSLVNVPELIFVAVDGKGNPNEKEGEYQKALEILYSIQYTIKMSKKGSFSPSGYFDYVVPPLEGLWWFDDNKATPPADKSLFNWTSLIRLPEFVDEAVFKWACDEVIKKKNIAVDKAYLFRFTEGLCVQCMHIGSYDDEPKTLKLIEDFITKNNLLIDINNSRKHHEIYISDPRKTEPSKMKTILRIPVKREI